MFIYDVHLRHDINSWIKSEIGLYCFLLTIYLTALTDAAFLAFKYQGQISLFNGRPLRNNYHFEAKPSEIRRMLNVELFELRQV